GGHRPRDRALEPDQEGQAEGRRQDHNVQNSLGDQEKPIMERHNVILSQKSSGPAPGALLHGPRSTATRPPEPPGGPGSPGPGVPPADPGRCPPECSAGP